MTVSAGCRGNRLSKSTRLALVLYKWVTFDFYYLYYFSYLYHLSYLYYLYYTAVMVNKPIA